MATTGKGDRGQEQHGRCFHGHRYNPADNKDRPLNTRAQQRLPNGARRGNQLTTHECGKRSTEARMPEK